MIKIQMTIRANRAYDKNYILTERRKRLLFMSFAIYDIERKYQETKGGNDTKSDLKKDQMTKKAPIHPFSYVLLSSYFFVSILRLATFWNFLFWFSPYHLSIFRCDTLRKYTKCTKYLNVKAE